jgi:hypothetical protein
MIRYQPRLNLKLCSPPTASLAANRGGTGNLPGFQASSVLWGKCEVLEWGPSASNAERGKTE